MLEFDPKTKYEVHPEEVFFYGPLWKVALGTALDGDHKGELVIIWINGKRPYTYTPRTHERLWAYMLKHVIKPKPQQESNP